jgi:protein TonB
MRVTDSNSEVHPKDGGNSAGLGRCLIEVDPAERGHSKRTRREALAASAIFQACAVLLLVIAPLFATTTRLVSQKYEVIPPYGGMPRANHPETPRRTQPTQIHNQLLKLNSQQIITPTQIPHTVSQGEEEKSGADDLSTTNLAGTGGSGSPEGIGLISLFDDRTGPKPPESVVTSAPIPNAPISISEGVVLGKLTHRVEPIYPAIARQTRTEGTVQLRAIISKDGSIEHLEVLSGSPLLVRAATGAVLQWRFHPTLLNGEPVEVQTYFTVVFHLGQ